MNKWIDLDSLDRSIFEPVCSYNWLSDGKPPCMHFIASGTVSVSLHASFTRRARSATEISLLSARIWR
jgi:hypothetical protein